jgi:hypothetical protein
MNTQNYIQALILCCLIFVQSSLAKGSKVKEDDMTCRVVLMHEYPGLNATGVEDHARYECDKISKEGFVDGSYNIELPLDLVEANKEALLAGNWFVRISQSTIGETKIKGYGSLATHIRLSSSSKIATVPPTEGLARLHTQSRRLSLSTGSRSIIILRVVLNDAAPKYNASQLVQYFFDPSNYSVSTHYNQCSSGALTFYSYNTSNPVTDVFIDASIKNFNKDQLYLAATTAAIAKLKKHPNQLADHVAYLLPSGTKDSYWFGFGGVKDWR